MILYSFLNLAATTVYTWCYSDHPTKNPFIFRLSNVLEREQVRSYMSIALPSAVLVCATWWAVEILLFMASKISVIAMSCMAVSVSLYTMIYQVSVAMNISSTALIGNALGEGDLRMAKTIGLVTVLEGTLINALISIGTYSQAGFIAELYTSDPDQLGTLTRCLQIMSLSLFLLATINCLQGTLKAVQMQREASMSLVMSLYLMSLPMAAYLAYDHELGVIGLWMGFSLGQLPVILAYLLIIYQIDWHSVSALLSA